MRRRRRRPAGRLAAATCISALLGLLLALALGLRRLAGGLTAVEVAGESMVPALRAGDFVLLRRRLPPLETLAGRIVAADAPGERLVVKRVVAVPGESVRAGRRVQVNGRALDEPYACGDPGSAQYRGVARLGPDELFLIGDARDHSTDSRDFGPVRAGRVRGVAIARYWPPRRVGLIRSAARRYRE